MASVLFEYCLLVCVCVLCTRLRFEWMSNAYYDRPFHHPVNHNKGNWYLAHLNTFPSVRIGSLFQVYRPKTEQSKKKTKYLSKHPAKHVAGDDGPAGCSDCERIVIFFSIVVGAMFTLPLSF